MLPFLPPAILIEVRLRRLGSDRLVDHMRVTLEKLAVLVLEMDQLFCRRSNEGTVAEGLV